MSDTTTNLEIEDVLSSIRRLVSGDVSVEDVSSEGDKFVLTPAYRVSDGPAAHWPENISSLQAETQNRANGGTLELTPDTRLPEGEAKEFVATFQHSREPIIADARDEAEDDWALDEFMVDELNWEDGTGDEDIDAMFDRAEAILSDDPSEYEMVMRDSGTILLNQRAKEMAVEFARAEGIDDLGDEFNEDVEPLAGATSLGREGEDILDGEVLEEGEPEQAEAADASDDTLTLSPGDILDDPVEEAEAGSAPVMAFDETEEAELEASEELHDFAEVNDPGDDAPDVSAAEYEPEAEEYEVEAEEEVLADAEETFEAGAVVDDVEVATESLAADDDADEEVAVAEDLAGFTAPDYWSFSSGDAEQSEDSTDGMDAHADDQQAELEPEQKPVAAASEPFILGAAFKIDPPAEETFAAEVDEGDDSEDEMDDEASYDFASSFEARDAEGEGYAESSDASETETSSPSEPAEQKPSPVFGTAYLRGRNWSFEDRVDETVEDAEVVEPVADDGDHQSLVATETSEAADTVVAEDTPAFTDEDDDVPGIETQSVFDNHVDAADESDDQFLTDTDTDDEVTEVTDADEEALRILVTDIVRKELQGETGERITRNLRRLIRKEINQAFEIRDME